MKKYIYSLFLFCFVSKVLLAQSPVLFNYGIDNVTKSEFERVFMKNNQKDKKPDEIKG